MAHKGYSTNEYGTRISVHTCDECGAEFDVCPALEPGVLDVCLGPDCPSYKPELDLDELKDSGQMIALLTGKKVASA